jgi:(p)ppGpp synthase/HD superfamily hydrolase
VSRRHRRRGEIGDHGSGREALALARCAHSGQRRPTDGAPYLEHPLEVADLLRGAGFDDEVQAAAILHDVLERSEVRVERIRSDFGPRIAELVDVLTEDASLDGYRERKAAHRARVAAAGWEAATIFVADKLANARELRRALEEGRGERVDALPTPVEDRVWHYGETLLLLRRAQPGLPFLGELDRELAALRKALTQR